MEDKLTFSLRIVSLRRNFYRSNNCLYDTESLGLRFFMDIRERPLGRVVFALKEEPLKERLSLSFKKQRS